MTHHNCDTHPTAAFCSQLNSQTCRPVTSHRAAFTIIANSPTMHQATCVLRFFPHAPLAPPPQPPPPPTPTRSKLQLLRLQFCPTRDRRHLLDLGSRCEELWVPRQTCLCVLWGSQGSVCMCVCVCVCVCVRVRAGAWRR
jgi:hypothetical protein